MIAAMGMALDTDRNGVLTPLELCATLRGTNICDWLQGQLDAAVKEKRGLCRQKSGAPKEHPLVTKKLNDPDAHLTLDDQLSLLHHCIEVGEGRATHVRNRKAVIFIGNTGAGKSTVVNYLLGCEMESVRKRDVGLAGNGRIVRVKAGSAVSEQASIGHSNQSATFIPDVIDTQDPGTVYIDCPGFLDNVSLAQSLPSALPLI